MDGKFNATLVNSKRKNYWTLCTW